MKVRKGDKIVLLNVKSVYGITYECILGTLEGVRTLYGKNIYKVKASKFYFLKGHTDMDGKEMEVSGEVFRLIPFTDEVKAQLKALRASCLQTQAAYDMIKKRPA